MEPVENAEMVEYLKRIPATENTIKYIEKMINIIRRLSSQPILGYHFSETPREDGTLIFQEFWLFTQDFVMEIGNVIEQDMLFDITYISGAIERVEFESDNFDFKTPTEVSTLRIVSHTPQWYIDLHASGQNCLHLLKVYDDQIKRNLEYIIVIYLEQSHV